MALSHPDQMHAVFGAAIAAHDVDTLVDLYETGAVQLQQDGTLINDHQALRVAFTHLLESDMSLQGKQQTAIITGDLALTSTHYEIPTTDGGTTRMVTAEVSRRQADGTWLIVIDAPYFA